MLCLGELAVHVPESGSFGEYARRYIGPGTGYMITWLYWLTGLQLWGLSLLRQLYWCRSGFHLPRYGLGLFFGALVFSLISVQLDYLPNLNSGWHSSKLSLLFVLLV